MAGLGARLEALEARWAPRWCHHQPVQVTCGPPDCDETPPRPSPPPCACGREPLHVQVIYVDGRDWQGDTWG